VGPVTCLDSRSADRELGVVRPERYCLPASMPVTWNQRWSFNAEGGFSLDSRLADKEPKNQNWVF